MRRDMKDRYLAGTDRRTRFKYPRNCKRFLEKDGDGLLPSPRSMRRAQSCAREITKYDCDVGDQAVITRWLKSKIGQHWDSIYSEACESVDHRANDSNRFFDSLLGCIDFNCTIDEEGDVCDDRGRKLGTYFDLFYIHPVTKTLEQIKKIKYVFSKNSDIKTVFEMDGHNFYKHEDLWYRVEMKLASEGVKYTPQYFYGHYCNRIDVFGYYDNRIRKYGLSPEGKEWYCHKKESANSKEIAALKNKYNLE